MSPALPVALVLVAALGPRNIGCARASLRAWREFLAIGASAIVASSVAYVPVVAGGHEVVGVVLTAAGEELMYRLGAVVLIGAIVARLMGRNWRDTARWGTGPVVAGLVGSALVFSALPGHVEQMQGVGTVVPFASLAVLLGYVALRTGSVLPCVVVHVLLDLAALAYFDGSIGPPVRLAIACLLLGGVVLAMMPAGHRLGLRRRVPRVIDLRDTPVMGAAVPAPAGQVARVTPGRSRVRG
jgi:membrane protease YdiL (CAAX protease family)